MKNKNEEKFMQLGGYNMFEVVWQIFNVIALCGCALIGIALIKYFWKK